VEDVPILEYKDFFLNINDSGSHGVHAGLSSLMKSGKMKSCTFDQLQASTKAHDAGGKGNGNPGSNSNASGNGNTKPVSLK